MSKTIISGWIEDPVITTDDWALLEEAGAVVLSAEQRARTAATIQEYNTAITLYRGSPRASEVKPLLDKVAGIATDLEAALKRLTTTSKAGRAAKMALIRQMTGRRREYPDLNAMLSEIRRLATDAAAASNACVDGLGRQPDPYLSDFLITLHGFYLQAGGKGTYSGRSVDFLLRASRLAGVRISRAALVQHVKRVGQKSEDSR